MTNDQINEAIAAQNQLSAFLTQLVKQRVLKSSQLKTVAHNKAAGQWGFDFIITVVEPSGNRVQLFNQIWPSTKICNHIYENVNIDQFCDMLHNILTVIHKRYKIGLKSV